MKYANYIDEKIISILGGNSNFFGIGEFELNCSNVNLTFKERDYDKLLNKTLDEEIYGKTVRERLENNKLFIWICPDRVEGKLLYPEQFEVIFPDHNYHVFRLFGKYTIIPRPGLHISLKNPIIRGEVKDFNALPYLPEELIKHFCWHMKKGEALNHSLLGITQGMHNNKKTELFVGFDSYEIERKCISVKEEHEFAYNSGPFASIVLA